MSETTLRGSPRVFCLYHGNCHDGLMAATVVRKALGASFQIDYVPVQYGEEPPIIMNGAIVIIVDFSYPLATLLAYRREYHARSVLIFDHHESARIQLESLRAAPVNCRLDEIQGLRANFDMTKSGAQIVWDYFFPEYTARPRMIEHVADRDLWKFKDPDTRNFTAFLSSHPQNVMVWENILDFYSDLQHMQSAYKEGSSILRQHQMALRTLVPDLVRRMRIAGQIVPVINVPKLFASDAIEMMLQDPECGADFALAYVDGPEGRRFSIRAREGSGFDVSAIAKQFGGGGHKASSGFSMPHDWLGDNS